MTAEVELPLAELDRLLRPIRRTLAFEARTPGSLRFVEANLGRWVQDLLALAVPEALREDIVILAGQLSGFDEAADRTERVQQMRAAVLHLDEVLGLPLPPQRMRPPRKKIPVIQQPDADDEPSGEGREGPSRSRSGRRRGRRGRGEASGSNEGSETSQGSKGSRGDTGDQDGASEGRSTSKSGESQGDDRNEGRRRSRGSRGARSDSDGDERRERRGEKRPRGWNGDLAAPISSLNLPEDLAQRLNDAGLTTVGSLLFLQPSGIEMLKVRGAGRTLDEGRAAVGGRRAMAWTRLRPDGSRVSEAILRGAGDIRLVWMDADRAQRWIASVGPGERTVVVGAFDGDAVLEPLAVRSDGKQVRMGRYAVPGVADEEMQVALGAAVPRLDRVRDPLPPAYRSGQPSLSEALAAVHGVGDLDKARGRLAFDESVISALVAGFTVLSNEKTRGIQHSILHTAPARVLSSADAQLDDEQELVLDMIKRDLRGSRPMRRVLFGEPGGGKGLVALCAAAMVAEGKCQVAFLSKDPILTEQRYAFAQPLLEAADLVARKVDRLDATSREALKKGQVHVVFGGLELLQPKVEYRRLGLVIVDDDDGEVTELVDKRPSPTPDVLVVPTGTPSVGQLVAGWPGYFMSYLKGLERPNVVVKPANQRVSAYAQARHALLEQRQVAVLFPLIENRDALDPTEASRVMKALSTDALPGAKLKLYHGAMPREDRVQAYQDFRHRRADALLSTTALEESAPVPGLEVAVVEHAHRFSHARLARLAGLGVSHVSLVVSEDTPEEQMEQLKTLVSDGWSPPFPSTSVPKLEHVDLETGTDEQLHLVVHARNLAMEILIQDRQLRSGSHYELVRLARERWTVWFGDAPCPLPEPSDDSRRRRKRRRRR